MPIPRETPRRAARQPINYNYLKQREVVSTNPPTERELRQQAEREGAEREAREATERDRDRGRRGDRDRDTQMPDVQDLLSDDKPLAPTPTRSRPIRSLITVRKEKTREKKPRKP
jgi:hypothetical protein